MSRLVPYLGGKRLLTKTILTLLPDHRLYCEPFAGSATILLAKPPSPCEVLNDLNGELINLFRIVQPRRRGNCSSPTTICRKIEQDLLFWGRTGVD